ncbi:GNAT family N-acetyltransferase [Gulosibacter sediminis]|uniref:GNAT family N-acetyltransferase n=1 Tax=Gulosibacter sediminis TaxID=1729695 RepID=UPI0024AD6B15|nr:GNAT family N-acetyltransferase [Gulosibacter sediminis]
MSDAYTVTHEPDNERYALYLDDEVAGFAHYTETEHELVFDHTVVDPDHRGAGVASKLVKSALDDVRDNSTKRVVPACSYVQAWIARHEDYSALTQR